jgi:hypothetical protein
MSYFKSMGQKFFKLSQVLVAQACYPSYSGGREQEDHGSKPAGINRSQDLSLKYLIQKGAGGVDQVVELVPCKHEALSSNPSTDKKENKEK